MSKHKSYHIYYAPVEILETPTNKRFEIEVHVYKETELTDPFLIKKCLRNLNLKETTTKKYKIIQIHLNRGRYVGLTSF
jgi:hypothetical protein